MPIGHCGAAGRGPGRGGGGRGETKRPSQGPKFRGGPRPVASGGIGSCDQSPSNAADLNPGPDRPQSATRDIYRRDRRRRRPSEQTRPTIYKHSVKIVANKVGA